MFSAGYWKTRLIESKICFISEWRLSMYISWIIGHVLKDARTLFLPYELCISLSRISAFNSVLLILERYIESELISLTIHIHCAFGFLGSIPIAFVELICFSKEYTLQGVCSNTSEIIESTDLPMDLIWKILRCHYTFLVLEDLGADMTWSHRMDTNT